MSVCKKGQEFAFRLFLAGYFFDLPLDLEEGGSAYLRNVDELANRSTRRRSSLVSLCPPQMSRDLTLDRTRVSAVGVESELTAISLYTMQM